MGYKTQTDPLDDYYNNTFWIGVTYQNCPGCISKMIVCNEDFLGNEFDDIMESGEGVEIKFSGELKKVCNEPIRNDISSYNLIILTSIEQQ